MSINRCVNCYVSSILYHLHAHIGACHIVMTHRHIDDKHRASALALFDAERSAMRHDKHLGVSQPETSAECRRHPIVSNLIVHIKYLLMLRLRYARAVISHTNVDDVVIDASHRYLHLMLGILHGVADEIHEHTLHLVDVESSIDIIVE